ncbi:hypothetical protein MKW92_050804 [Papaver armeniacum]|nr:hypothetical protein MKW92_050804 [Papaver armeniacum]
MRSPRLQELARLRELAENEKDEERKARNESLRLTPQLHVASQSPIEQVVNQKNNVKMMCIMDLQSCKISLSVSTILNL